MSEQDYVRFGELKIFMHQIYEFKKGVRNLVLCTMCPTCAALVAERLRGQRIEFLIQEVTDNKVNLISENAPVWMRCGPLSTSR